VVVEKEYSIELGLAWEIILIWAKSGLWKNTWLSH